ncbi:conserved hypothetical protein [Candidatus Roizmanbacteria bacterium]|nr:conserved hypothetical protein [Candidatus Roizmanbacteria bacterium]
MNILVFSDTHLYLPFDQKKFNFLKKIINESDQVIINGDFFDDYMISFSDFIQSSWNQLFPLLKEKKAIYIFGNHDLEKFSDKRLSLFSDLQVNNYQLTLNNKIFNFEHGHKTRPTPDTKFNLDWKTKHYGMVIVHLIRYLFTKMFAKSAVIIMYGRNNNGSKQYMKTNYQINNNHYYVIGHNHFGEVDEKNHFACSGAILYGFAQYLTIDSISGEIKLHEEWYE